MKVAATMTSSSNTMKINILGPMEIWKGGRRIDLPSSKKARALLAYLIASGRPQRRERLTEFLWDVADDPRSGLRWCLTKIRQLVDEPGKTRIVADRESAEFRGEDALIDLFMVRERLRKGVSALTLKELQELAILFRGTFLEGLELPDYDDFQSWLVAAREDALQQQLSILQAILTLLQGDPAAAVPYARLIVQRDPLHEPSRAQLARLLVALGRNSEAKQLLEAGKRLASELGNGRATQIEKLEAELYQPATALRRPPEAVVEAPPPLEPSRAGQAIPEFFVGRMEERSRLRRFVESPQPKPGRHVVLITGEPGIGKSRLMSDLASHLASMRGTVLSGSSYEAEARRPYGPWTDAIRSIHPSVMGDVLREKLSPLLTGLTAEDETPGGRERLFAGVVDLLATRAHSAPPVLLQFDDVQWYDEASAELLHYVVRMTQHRPVFLALTARGGELADNEPLMRVFRGFRLNGWMDEIALEPLSKDDIALLVGHISSTVDVEAVFDECSGNPLFAIELARASDESGALANPTLTGLIRDRIDRLPAQAGDILRWAAVLGARFSINRLASLVSRSFEDLTSALELLERHALVRESASGCGFTHGVVRRTVYDNLSESRRRLMHRRVAQALEQDTNPQTAAELAHHAFLAGETAKAARASLAAGRQCMRIYANSEALAFARSGMRYSEALPESDRIGLQIELLEIMLAARRPADVESTARQLEELSERALAAGDAEHARLGFHLLSYIRWEGGDWSAARNHSLRAEFVSRTAEPREQVVAMAEAARCLAMLERDLTQAEALALEARAQAANSGVETVAIPDALGMLRFHRGAWDEAAGLFESARSLARRHGDRAGEFRALEHLIVLELERNHANEARTLSRDLITLASRLREGSEAPFATCLEALAREAAGEEASTEIDAALEALRIADAKHRLAYALLRATRGDFSRGDVQKARARGEEALRLAEILARPSETALARVVLTRCALQQGASADAERHRRYLQPSVLKQVAAHVRQAAEEIGLQSKGVKRGTRTGGTPV
ncbi:MAG TPA: AAA family ATPase [Terriglobia bacterium]|nr:AAA family ATPase [Terriglobia bacterium]